VTNSRKFEQPNIDAKLFWKNVQWLKRNCLSCDRPRRLTSEGALKIIARRGDNGNKALALGGSPNASSRSGRRHNSAG
jgi:hypothetical protein